MLPKQKRLQDSVNDETRKLIRDMALEQVIHWGLVQPTTEMPEGYLYGRREAMAELFNLLAKNQDERFTI